MNGIEKQENISISDSNVISAQSTPPLEGNGIKVDSEGHISIDPEVVPEKDTLPQDVADIADELASDDSGIDENQRTLCECFSMLCSLRLLGDNAGGNSDSLFGADDQIKPYVEAWESLEKIAGKMESFSSDRSADLIFDPAVIFRQCPYMARRFLCSNPPQWYRV